MKTRRATRKMKKESRQTIEISIVDDAAFCPRTIPVPPPRLALQHLVTAAVQDLDVARPVLGLIASVIGRSDNEVFFPNYKERLSDIKSLRGSLRQQARRFIDWGIRDQPLQLNDVLGAKHQIVAAVAQMRQKSPIGRRFRRRVEGFRKRYPELSRDRLTTGNGCVIRLEPNWTGRPLTGGMLQQLEQVRAPHLQILQHGESWNFVFTPGVLTVRLKADGYTVHEITLAVERPEKTGERFPCRIEGPLINFCETGTEGAIWAIEDDERFGYEAVVIINEGDHLAIYDELGYEVWAGTIKCDKKVGWRRYPSNPKHGQQCALGYWVHWIQRGFKSDDWARFFIRPGYSRYRGVLLRRKIGICKLGPE